MGLLLVAIVLSSDAKLFKKKWIKFPWFKKPSFAFEHVEHPKIVEIVKHVPVIQKVYTFLFRVKAKFTFIFPLD